MSTKSDNSVFFRKVSDSEELLRTMSRFEETKFLIYLNAEAPVLRKNAKRSKA